jgi:hypothetical protein
MSRGGSSARAEAGNDPAGSGGGAGVPSSAGTLAAVTASDIRTGKEVGATTAGVNAGVLEGDAAAGAAQEEEERAALALQQKQIQRKKEARKEKKLKRMQAVAKRRSLMAQEEAVAETACVEAEKEAGAASVSSSASTSFSSGGRVGDLAKLRFRLASAYQAANLAEVVVKKEGRRAGGRGGGERGGVMGSKWLKGKGRSEVVKRRGSSFFLVSV